MSDFKPEHLPLLPRYAEIKRLQAYYEGKQYEGRPDFWTGLPCKGGTAAPLRERKPCIIYPLPKAAVQQVVRFTFGEGRFPTLKVEAQEDKEAAAYESLALSTDDAELLEHGLVDIIESGRLRSVMRTIMTRGLAERTAVAIASVKKGRLVFDIPHAKDCSPTFENDDPSLPVTGLVWAYQYDKPVLDGGRVVTKKFWFRRDVTEDEFIDYAPVEVKHSTDPVEWKVADRVSHGFGFCPVLWIRNLDDTSEPGGIDGFSLYEDLFDEFDALNFSLSQRHRGITFFGTPQPYETGVEDGDGPEADGRVATGYSPSTSPTGLSAETERGGGSPKHGAAKIPARRLSPDRIWSYEGPEVRLGLLETTGRAFEVATLHVEDIRGRLLEAMSVVLASIEAFTKGGGEMNAKFLVLAYAPLLNLVDELRDATWWPCGLLALLSLSLRILAKAPEGLLVPNAKTLAKLLARFEIEVASTSGTGTEKVWMLPKITPTWGESFSPSNAEIGEAVSSAVSAKDGGIVPLKDAVAYVAPHFGIDDVDAAVDELTKQAEEQKAAEQEALQQQADDAHEKKQEERDDAHEKNLELVKAKAKAKPNPGKGPKGPKA